MTTVWVILDERMMDEGEQVPIICSSKASAEAWIAARWDQEKYFLDEVVLDVQNQDWWNPERCPNGCGYWGSGVQDHLPYCKANAETVGGYTSSSKPASQLQPPPRGPAPGARG